MPDETPDAARFALSPSGRVRWVLEKNHLPVDFGTVERAMQTGRGRTLDRQVETYFSEVERAAGQLG